MSKVRPSEVKEDGFKTQPGTTEAKDGLDTTN
jgi:hypothetical protein